jgi:AraC-like DNA-binding protein
MPSPSRIPEGFRSQRLVVLPALVRQRMQAHPLLQGLLVTDAGIFLQARHHFIERRHGASTTLVIVCLAGTGWVRIGDQIHAVTPGAFVWLPAGCAHSYGAAENDPWSIEWAHFTGIEVEAWRELLELPPSGGLQALSPTIAGELHFGRIWAQLDHGYTAANLAAAAGALRTALATAAQQRSTQEGQLSTPQRVAASMAWMKSHLAEPLRLAELASQAGLSVPHYGVLFRAQTGFSPIDWFIRLRIQRACELLDTTRQTIAEIGRQVGFADPYYFTRCFRRVVGQPPRAYRKIPKG